MTTNCTNFTNYFEPFVAGDEKEIRVIRIK